MLGAVLVPAEGQASSSSSGTAMPDHSFVGTLARANVATTTELLRNGGYVARQRVPWPVSEYQLFQLAAELRHVVTWALTLGENDPSEAPLSEDKDVTAGAVEAGPVHYPSRLELEGMPPRS